MRLENLIDMGKLLNVTESNLLFSFGYLLHDSHNKYRLTDGKYGIPSRYALSRRLLRAEITGLYNLHNGDRLAVAKKGLYLQRKGSGVFEKVFSMPRGSKPLNICIAPSGKLFFGEYFQNMGKQAVNIYGSIDNGLTWK